MASFRLEFEQGGETRQVSFDKDSISIGRDRSSDFVLDHPTVSRQHALIVHEGPGQFQLVVLSRGGLTAIDGQPVEASEIDLYDGAGLTFGQYTVCFRSEEAPKAPSTPASGSGYGAGASGSGAGDGAPAGGGADREQPVEEAAEESADDGGAGIKSWDEIAASDEESEAEANSSSRTIKDIRDDHEDEETNPVIVGAGVILAVGFLAFGFLGGGDDEDAQQRQAAQSIFEQEPIPLSPDCLEPASCEEDAYHHYERGIDMIEGRAIETGNLFRGYHRLLLAEAYLEEAGIDEIPSDMEQWHEKHDMARESLDTTFRELRMRYHQADQRDRPRDMRRVIDEVEEHFPEREAREAEWARNKERELRRR